MQQSITKDHLFVTTNDHDLTRVIDFSVTHGPELGRLLVENPDGSLMPVSGFTQEQINKNLVLYEHNKPMVGLTSLDVIRFDIDTQNAPTTKDVEFSIEVSVGNFGSGNLDQLVVLHTLEVKEGGMAIISQEYVDMSRLFSLWQGKGKSEFAKKLKIILHSPPSNGWIETESGNSTFVSRLSFNREDIRKKRVRYYHDDSDTFSDSVNLGFYLLDDKGFPDILLFNGTLNITIYPINDNPFLLWTRTAVLDIVQGQSVTIGSKILNVTDADGVPRDVVYETIKAPTSGKLVMKNVSINNFTQEDINNKLIQYVHDGTNESRSSFSFKVSDGKHKPDYATLDIAIVPIKLHLKNLSAIEVQQGSTAVFLSYKNLGAETNAKKQEIVYNITSLPLHGHIFVNDDVLRFFRQTDIDNRLVFYMQSDLTASEDYFVVTIHSGKISIKDQVINITVVPQVQQKRLIANASGVTFITLETLNASKLALQTNSNPKFIVFKFPKFGVLKKFKQSTLSKRSFPKSFEFTHEDIVNKRVMYEGKDMELKGSTVDSFEFVLTAPRAQPAKGKFTITVQPPFMPATTETPTISLTPLILKPHPPPAKPEIAVVVPTVPDTSNGELQQSNLNNDHLIIVGSVLGVAVVILLIIIAVKCRSIRRNRRKNRSSGSCFTHRNSTVVGSRTAQSNLDFSDHNHSSGNISLSDDIPPPPPPPTSPCVSPLGCIGGSGTSKNRSLKKRGRCLDVEPSLPPPPYILENGEWTEINVPVPTCKVPHINHDDEDNINETMLKGPYLLRDPCEGEDWSNYEGSELRFGTSCNPVLRKNQYWV